MSATSTSPTPPGDSPIDTVLIENKPTDGFDPVTVGDKAAEQAIRALIMEIYPDHGMIGEEFDAVNDGAQYCWTIDPIDGTKSFITGIPLWGTLIALFHQGKPPGAKFLMLPEH